MSFSFDPSNPVIYTTRILVFDTSDVPPLPKWQDEELWAILNIFSSQGIIVGLSGFQLRNPVPQIYSVRRAAAALLRSWGAGLASNSVVKLLDVTLDPKSGAAALNTIADGYITSEENDGYFAVSEMVVNSFSMRERLTAMALRRIC